MESLNHLIAVGLALLLVPAHLLPVQKGEILSGDEQDKLREEQDPANRIPLYLEIAQARLGRFQAYRAKPVDPKYDYGAYLDELLGEYIGVYDELKNWIEFQYRRDGDMRSGLRALLERGPHQLAELRKIQESPGPYTPDYENSLQDAIDQVADTLDGATRALADQEKKFPEIKQERKEALRQAKQRAKEEARRSEEERKLRKRSGKSRIPGEQEED